MSNCAPRSPSADPLWEPFFIASAVEFAASVDPVAWAGVKTITMKRQRPDWRLGGGDHHCTAASLAGGNCSKMRYAEVRAQLSSDGVEGGTLMKLFMVIYLSGKIVGAIGPLSGDMDECRQRAAARMAQTQAETGDETYVASELAVRCEFYNEAPRY